jgi:transcriptional regulator with XRE-family HTH domain
MINVNTIAVNIRNARLRRNYSQDYLAMKLKMSQNGYSKIELGRTKLTLEKFLTISEILEIDIMELFKQADDYSLTYKAANG